MKDTALTLDELEQVHGGIKLKNQADRNTNEKNSADANEKELFCPYCNEMRVFRLGSGGRAHCKTCNKEIFY